MEDNQENEVINESKYLEVIPEKKKKRGSYITGTIGAIIGAIIAAIPWVLIYFYTNAVAVILAMLIVGGAFLGYKVFRGRVGKALPVIITVISLIVITLITTVISPIILMYKQGEAIALNTLLELYTNERQNVKTAILQDLATSLVFMITALIIVIRSVWNKIKAETENLEKTKNKKVLPKVITIIIILIIIAVAVYFYIDKRINDNIYTIPSTNIQLEIADSQKLYSTKEEITNAFGATAAQYYNFAIQDAEADKYDIYGQVLPLSQYKDYEFAEIMKEDRDYIAKYMGEEVTSQVEDKKIEEKDLKAYNYTYKGNDGNQYRAIIYLYKAEKQYLWINIYSDLDVELTQIDTIVENLLK